MATEHVLTLDLHDDPALIEAYERHHAPGAGRPAVEAAIRRSGIREMRIYRLETRLVMVIAVEAGFSFEAKASADAADPDVQRWEALMARFQVVRPDGATWLPMRRIYELGARAVATE